MTKYIKTTDHTGAKGSHSGYHSVEDDFVLPLSTKNETFEFVEEDEVRAAHPRLFGEDADGVAVAKPKKETKAEKEAREKAEKEAANS